MILALRTIRNHVENINLMITAAAWGKPEAECFEEIEKSAGVIQTQVSYLEEMRDKTEKTS